MAILPGYPHQPPPPTPPFQPLDDRCKVILNSNTTFHDSFEMVSLNLCDGTAEFSIRENEKFEVLNWITSIPKDEVISLVFDKPDGKILCILRLLDITLEKHQVTFNKPCSLGTGGHPLSHLIKIKHRGCERVNNF